jgi:hypothetical protein
VWDDQYASTSTGFRLFDAPVMAAEPADAAATQAAVRVLPDLELRALRVELADRIAICRATRPRVLHDRRQRSG